MTATVTDLAVRSLAGLADLKVERTQYRGHARELAAAAAVDLIIVHGGDGSINEVVNGVMGRGGGPADLSAGGGGGDPFASGGRGHPCPRGREGEPCARVRAGVAIGG